MSLLLQGAQFIVVRLVVLACFWSATIITSHVPFCILFKSEHGTSQVSFLINTTSTSAHNSLVFYWKKWTADKLLEDCLKSNDKMLVERYLSVCQRESAPWDQYQKFNHFNFTAFLEDDDLCQITSNMTSYTSLTEKAKQMDLRTKRRNKRAWVFPGTLWCGRGSSAKDYEQLGMFEYADRCCREHDHCEHVIRSFSVNFGVFNPTFFTVSHCDCDHRFKQCLLSGNDTISNMVGYSFFNVLKLRCFDFIQKRQCTQYNWLGLCTMVKLAPVAVMKEPTAYNSTNLTSEKPEIPCMEKTVKLAQKHKGKTSKMKNLLKNPKSCSPIYHNKEDRFQLGEKRPFKKNKSLQTTENTIGKKYMKSNSFTNVTMRPQKNISKSRNKKTINLDRIIQSTPKTQKINATYSSLTALNIKQKLKTFINQTKPVSVNNSQKIVLQNKKKRGNKPQKPGHKGKKRERRIKQKQNTKH